MPPKVVLRPAGKASTISGSATGNAAPRAATVATSRPRVVFRPATRSRAQPQAQPQVAAAAAAAPLSSRVRPPAPLSMEELRNAAAGNTDEDDDSGSTVSIMSDGSTSASSASSRAGSLGSRRKFYSSKNKGKSKGNGKKHVSKELQTLRRKSMNRGFLQTLANKKRMLPAGATASLSRDTSGKHHDYGDEDDDDHENENEEDGDDGTETEIDSEDDDSNDEDDASDMDDDDDEDAIEGSDEGDEDGGDSKAEQQQSDKDRDSSLAPFARAFGRKLSRREAARRQELFQRISLLNRIKRKRKKINDPVISQQLSDEDLRLMPTEKLQELDLEITYHENSHKKVQSWRSYILLGTKILEEIWRSLPEETKEHFDLQDLSKELFFNINTFDDDLYDVYDYYGFQPSHPVMALAQSYMKFVGVFTYTRMMSKQTMSAATAAAPSGSVPHDPAAAMHNGMRVPNPAGPDATGAHANANANANPSLSSGGAPAPNDQSAPGLFTPSSSQPHGTTSSFPNLQRLRDQARRRRQQQQQQQQEQQGPQQQQQPAASASVSAPLTPRPGYLPPPPNAPSVRGPVSLSTARADEQRSSSSRDTQPHTQQAKTVTFE